MILLTKLAIRVNAIVTYPRTTYMTNMSLAAWGDTGTYYCIPLAIRVCQRVNEVLARQGARILAMLQLFLPDTTR
jgi:hypothetical protein